MTALTDWIEGQKRLCEAATPGPWRPCLGSGNCEMTALRFDGCSQSPGSCDYLYQEDVEDE